MSTRTHRRWVVMLVALAGLAPLARAAGLVSNAINIEDMIATPDNRWVIASGMAVGQQQPGALYVVNSGSRAINRAYPNTTTSTAPVAGKACKEPSSVLAPHGLALAQANGKPRLYVVNHGGRESIEVFSVDLSDPQAGPKIAWFDCILLPPNTMANSVAAANDGSLFVTASGDALAQGRPSPAPSVKTAIPPSGVLAWGRQEGWRVIPSDAVGLSNGILLSADNRFIYVADWLKQAVLELNVKDAKSNRTAQVAFMPDNLRWSKDGSIWVAGQHAAMEAVMNCYLSEKTACDIDSAVARIEPRTMTTTCSQAFPATSDFSAGTVATPVGNEVWIGSFRAHAIAVKQLDLPPSGRTSNGECSLK
jgi:hypothetical protein